MIEYKLKGGKRRTIAVEVKNGEVFLRVPFEYIGNAVLMRRAETFLNSKEKWIAKKLNEFDKSAFEILPGFAEGKEIYLFGYKINKRFDSNYKKITFECGTLIIPIKYANDLNKYNEALKKWYKVFAYSELSERLKDLSQRLKKSYSDFALSSAKGKWGSCSSSKKIMLCWRLILLPDELIEYVIVHELCHTDNMSHSKAFWREVERYIPDYKERRKLLKKYNRIMNFI